MFFGIDTEKLLLIGLLAALLIGHQRLPQAARWLARTTAWLRDWSRTAKDRLKEEMGEDFQDVEWRKLDPRQYDPRRIVRDALLDEPQRPVVQAPTIDVPSPDPVRLTVPLDPIGGPDQQRTAGIAPMTAAAGIDAPVDAEAREAGAAHDATR